MARPPGSKRSRRKFVIWLIILIAVAVAAAVAVSSQKRERPVVVTTEAATIRTVTQTVSATGRIQPEIEVKISPEVAGEIIELPVREGATVNRGDLLLRIRSDNYQFQVDQREADLSAARAALLETQARLVRAEEDFRRAADLAERNLISAAELTAAKTSFQAAEASRENGLAQIRRAEGQLRQALDQLAKTTIYSPIDGTISSLTSEAGERVVGTGQFAGTEVMRVADLERMEVRVNVNENDIVNVKVGDRARIRVDAFPQRPFEGEVREIASTARTRGQNTQEEVTNFEVRIRFLDRDPALRPGMSANTDIETQTVSGVIAVPIQSVTVRSREGNRTLEQLATDREKEQQDSRGEGAAAAVNQREQSERERIDRDSLQRVVFVRQGDSVRMVPVETGIADTTHMEIRSGLSAGDEVVSGSFSVITRTLTDGARVRSAPPPSRPSASSR
jgi:HlyD family secretion protein